MTERLTEKELAEKLGYFVGDEFDPGEDLDFTAIARQVAAWLGVTFAPEKPEPGTWHVTRTEGYPAYVEWDGDLIVFEPGALDHYWALASDWPELDPATPPARVVPAKPPVLTEAEVGMAWNRTSNTYGRVFEYLAPNMRIQVTGTVNAALHEHGGARELPGRGKVRDAVSKAYANRLLQTVEDDVDLIVRAVMGLYGGGDQ